MSTETVCNRLNSGWPKARAWRQPSDSKGPQGPWTTEWRMTGGMWVIQQTNSATSVKESVEEKKVVTQTAEKALWFYQYIHFKTKWKHHGAECQNSGSLPEGGKGQCLRSGIEKIFFKGLITSVPWCGWWLCRWMMLMTCILYVYYLST